LRSYKNEIAKNLSDIWKKSRFTVTELPSGVISADPNETSSLKVGASGRAQGYNKLKQKWSENNKQITNRCVIL
jgi:hypothetical protein